MYTVTKEELLDLARQIYEEASVGYMDLKDSACERLLNKFLETKTFLPNTTLNVQPTTVSLVGGSVTLHTGYSGGSIVFPN